MFYKAELNFLQNTLHKCHIQTALIDPTAPINDDTELGVRLLFDSRSLLEPSVRERIEPFQHNTVYKLTDPLSFSYLFLLLPDLSPEKLLIVGPYLGEEVSEEQILESGERYGMDSKQSQHLKSYYASLPIISDSSYVFSAMATFAETLWGKDLYTFVDINKSFFDAEVLFTPRERPAEADNNLINMQILERRYATENELMEAVASGQNQKAELLFAGFSRMTMEQRISDPVRNLKNYAIIMNTLMRKSAEKGGVHPIYLDSTSSKFAHTIERMTTLSEVGALMPEMYDTYCNLVKRYSLKKFSPPVQKAILCIDSDLTADLTLRGLAEMQQISSGYLSTLFKKETGQTLTEFIMHRRMKQAARLLRTTKLQVQTVAQHCGIFDVHYFSKTFKKHYGLTPKEYRESK